jgi:DNA-binding PadR family transcriptional regulator
MVKKPPKTADPTSAGDSFTSVEYWNGLIKMSLSKFFILCVLQQRSLHGYEVAKEVAVLTRGCCSPTEGTIYPVLREFEAGGLVTSHTETVSGRGRKIYTITQKGCQAFKVASDAWMEATACVIESRKNLQL